VAYVSRSWSDLFHLATYLSSRSVLKLRKHDGHSVEFSSGPEVPERPKVTGPWYSKDRVVEYTLVNNNLKDGDRWGLLFLTWLITILVSLLNLGCVIF
jgi:hypothetical protein